MKKALPIFLAAALALAACTPDTAVREPASPNPISPAGVYIADPSARVMPDGRLYVYGSLDLNPDAYCSNRYHVLSTADVRTWVLHPDAFVADDILYAPDACLSPEKGKYLLYYDTPSGKEFVAESDSPAGPFGNPALIAGPTQIDPAVFVDDDGQAYYFWGQFSGRGARMTPDRKALVEDSEVMGLVTEEEHFFHEGSFVFKRGDYYYYVFADISRRHRPTCLGYAMATSPMGPYTYKGVIIDNYHCDPETWNNHGSVVEFNGKWYVLYHRSTHGTRSMRKACIEPISFNEDGTIDEVEMSTQGAGGPLDAFGLTEGARACHLEGHARIRLSEGSTDREELGGILGGDAAAWKYLDFGKGVRSVSMRLKSQTGGTVVIRTDASDGPVIGTVEVPAGIDWTTMSVPVKKTRGVHALWLTFEGEPCPEPYEMLSIDWIRFH